MSSRSWYDWIDTTAEWDNLKDASNDPLFSEKFFTPEGVYLYSDHDPRADLPLNEHFQNENQSYNSTIADGKAAVPFTSSIRTSVLCDRCKFLVSSSKRWQGASETDWFHQDITFQQICDAANSGCHLCHLRMRVLEIRDMRMLERIDSCKSRFWEISASGSTALGRTRPGYGIALEYSLTDDGKAIEKPGLLLCEAEGCVEDTTENDFAHLRLDDLNGLPWDLMRTWIEDCQNKHVYCKLKARNRNFVPSRLLWIPEHLGPQSALSVISTAGVSSNIQYATLSHCWGQSPFHAFIRSRPEEYFRAIPTNQMPKLFQDAINILHRLGLRHVWIDCFCIKQNSMEDWIAESATMDRVYQSSFLNIAASRCSSSDMSMMHAQHPLDVTPCIIETDWDCNEDSSKKRWLAFSPDLLYERNIEQAPLAERGWVVQELFLAPRVLYLGKFQAFWECDSLRACETCPLGIPGSAVKKNSVHPISLQFDSARGTHYESYKYRIWKIVVNSYSRCELTQVTKDKLVALSGLAKAIGAPYDEYLEGLWKKDLAYQLLWRSVARGKRSPTTQDHYQAPSWSWASFNGPVNYRIREPINDLAAELLLVVWDARTEKASSDPTGRIKSGFLQVEAPLALGSVKKGKSSSGKEWLMINGGFGTTNLEDANIVKGNPSIYCMPVELKNRKSPEHMLIVGLILYVSEEQPDALQRFGYFTVTDHEGKAEMGTFLKSFREPARRPPSSFAKPGATQTAAAIVFGLPTYSFTII